MSPDHKKMNSADGKRAALSIAAGIFLALVLEVSYNLAVSGETLVLATVEHVPEAGLPMLLEMIRQVTVPGYGLMSGVLAAVLAGIICRTRERAFGSRYAGNPLIVFMAVVFGILQVSGLMMRELDDIPSFSGIWQLSGSALLVLGWAFLFYLAAVAGLMRLDRTPSGPEEEPQRGYVWKVFFLILLFWSVWIIAYYPASMDNDVFNQLRSWLYDHNDHHPWFTTVLLGLCYDFGKAHFSENAGIFLYILLRDLFIAFVFAKIVDTMRRSGISKALCRGTAFFYAATPFFGAYAKHAFKDTLSMGCYAAWLLTLFLLIRDFCGNPDRKMKTAAPAAALHGAAALLTCLTRHNFIYVTVPVEIIAAAVFMTGRRRKEAMLLLLSVAMLFGYRFALNRLEIRSGSPMEALSIPLQQIARVYRDDRDALSIEDTDMLAGVFDMDKIAGYDPSVSDPVKSGLRPGISLREAAPVLGKIWLRFLGRFPVTYWEAAVGQSYGYYAFTPRLPERSGNWNSGMTVFDWIGCNGDFDEQFDFHYIDGLHGVRSVLHAWVKVWDKIPLLSFTDVCALYTWLTVLCGVYLLLHRKYLYLLPVLSMLLLAGTCAASPVNDCFRYFCPVAAAFPVLPCILKAARTADHQNEAADGRIGGDDDE